ncbi:AraC family transcriptional regulator [uncultured Apibacter sp.]|uniref:helix-turn-helix domain-containing protein n=1 Tax=uncultured Apibacter sp. TaxID=1778616 RepID=UPI0025F830FC|nr:AraC family transcriptional regulator [uncultured Apibacter sp.]
MKKIETIQDFYKKLSGNNHIKLNNDGIGHFNVFPRGYCSPTASFHRRDFFKISLITEGTGVIHFANESFTINQPALFFSNPLIPHSWEPTSPNQLGWFCLFTEEFIQSWDHSFSVKNYPMFRRGENPIILLDEEATEHLSYIFRKIMQEMSSDYIYKYSKLRNYLQLIIHEALKLYPEIGSRNKQIDAAHRITYHFLELLENQFPIENTDMPLKLRTVQDFALKLSVHENHLNSVVKEVTGKNTSQHIAFRISEEAKALLKNTNWTVTEIAYSLSFEYPSHFTSFFKKNVGMSPKKYRLKII